MIWGPTPIFGNTHMTLQKLENNSTNMDKNSNKAVLPPKVSDDEHLFTWTSVQAILNQW